MEATTTRINGLVFGTVCLAVASAIALGVMHLLEVAEEIVTQEQDTTAYLLGGANGKALRAAIKRRG